MKIKHNLVLCKYFLRLLDSILHIAEDKQFEMQHLPRLGRNIIFLNKGAYLVSAK